MTLLPPPRRRPSFSCWFFPALALVALSLLIVAAASSSTTTVRARARGLQLERSQLVLSDPLVVQNATDEARRDIAAIARISLYPSGDNETANDDSVPSTNMAAKFLRLAFHDAVGGMDGCVDMSDPDNAGLDLPIAALETVVARHRDVLSRADIWALAALVGVETLQEPQSPDPSFVEFPLFWVGRIDCDDVQFHMNNQGGGQGQDVTVAMCTNVRQESIPCSASTGDYYALPSPDLTTHELFTYFRQTFGFTIRETVIAMGAHTVGVLARNNSGFDGGKGWVDTRNVLNTEYYAVLVGGGGVSSKYDVKVNSAPFWSPVAVNNSDLVGVPDRVVWRRRTDANADVGPQISTGSGGEGWLLMLNSDIAIVRNLSNYVDSIGNTLDPQCNFAFREDITNTLRTCPAAPRELIEMVAEFKHDEVLWKTEFRDVLTRMFSTGYYTTNTGSCPILGDDGGSTDMNMISCTYPLNDEWVLPTPRPTVAPSSHPTPVDEQETMDEVHSKSHRKTVNIAMLTCLLYILSMAL